WMRQPRVGATDLWWKLGVTLGETLDVQFVDDCLVPRCARALRVPPIEERIDDDRFGEELCGIHARRALDPRYWIEIEKGIRVRNLAIDRSRVRIEQQLVGVAEVPRLGSERTVNAKTITLTWPHVRHVAVPGVGGDLGQRQACLGSVSFEQAKLYSI